LSDEKSAQNLNDSFYENSLLIKIMTNSKLVYPVCFWCGDVFSETIELGDEFTPEERKLIPEQCVLHYDPCPKCFGEWTQGCVFIEYDNIRIHGFQPELARPDGTKIYPTGRMCVITVEQFSALFSGVEEIEPISFLSKENFAMYFDRKPEISCFWCGQPFDGSERTEKSLRAIKSYDPCDTCKEKWSGKCVFIECDVMSDRAVDGVFVTCDSLPMHPTGRLMRVETAEAKRLFGNAKSIEFIPVAKFRILSGEDKPRTRKAAAAAKSASAGASGTSNRASLLKRNDDY
jgi:hypothetical protein